MIWGDNSTLLNHGHLLLTVNSLYDQAIYFTNEEMKARGKGDIDVQAIVERPHVFILGRCGSSEVDQLAYFNTKKACLQSLDIKITTSNGVEVTDIVPFFPSRSLRLESRKGAILDVLVAVVMQGSTKNLQFPFLNPTLLSRNG